MSAPRIAVAKVQFVVLDVNDPDGLSRFWCEVLGTEEDARIGGDGYILLKATEGSAPLALQNVPDPKLGKNRMHLELAVEDLDAAVASIEALGGRKLRDVQEFEGYAWINMADPEGNEFDIAKA